MCTNGRPIRPSHQSVSFRDLFFMFFAGACREIRVGNANNEFSEELPKYMRVDCYGSWLNPVRYHGHGGFWSATKWLYDNSEYAGRDPRLNQTHYIS